jgi:hypothetical protein
LDLESIYKNATQVGETREQNIEIKKHWELLQQRSFPSRLWLQSPWCYVGNALTWCTCLSRGWFQEFLVFHPKHVQQCAGASGWSHRRTVPRPSLQLFLGIPLDEVQEWSY